MKSAGSNGSGCTAPFLLFWLVGWSAGTLLFDGIAAWGLYKQFGSLSYKEVTGVVTKSEMQVDHDSEDGTSYRLDVEYSYEVDGIGYANDRLRYGFEMNERREVQRLVDEYTVDKSIIVYHHPADPKDSVLVRGLSAMDFFLPLFLVPFNMIMIGVFSFTVGSRVRGWFCKRPITIKVWQRDVNWFAKVYKFLPIAAAGVAALAISFISIFVVGFGQFVVPGWILIIPAWCLVIAGSLFAWLKTSPTVLLEVEEYHQRLTVRQPGRRARDPIDLASVQSIAARGDNIVLECGSAPLELSCSGESEAKWLRDWLWERWRGGSRD